MCVVGVLFLTSESQFFFNVTFFLAVQSHDNLETNKI